MNFVLFMIKLLQKTFSAVVTTKTKYKLILLNNKSVAALKCICTAYAQEKKSLLSQDQKRQSKLTEP